MAASVLATPFPFGRRLPRKRRSDWAPPGYLTR
jgi:hypothetical protein